MTTNNQIAKNSDKSFVLNLTISVSEIQKSYQHSLEHVAADIEIKGFRKGKAPLDLVKQQISEEKLLEETAQHLIPQIYQDKVTEFGLKPILQPKIKITNPPITIDKDWILEITGCELPELKLDETYLADVKKSNLENKDKPKEEKVNKILEILLAKSKVTLPAILLESEVEYKLSQLITQVTQANLTLETYFKNQNTTLEDYKTKITAQINKEWTLNLAIDTIAKGQNLVVTQTEVEEEVKKYPNSKADPGFLSFILLQNKTLEYLLNLS